MARLECDGHDDRPAPHAGILADVAPSDLAAALLALLTVERLRIRADALRPGDRVLWVRSGVVTLDTVASVTRFWLPGSVLVTTEAGTCRPCPSDDRSFLRVTD